MRRKAKHKFPAPADIAGLQNVMRPLMESCLPSAVITDSIVAEVIEPLLQLCEFGHAAQLLEDSCDGSLTSFEMKTARTGAVSYFPYFRDSVDRARATGDRHELARWALALLLVRQLETHLPVYAEKLTEEMLRGSKSAAARDVANTIDFIEAFERDNNVQLSSKSPKSQITACALACKRGESTVRKALQNRTRIRKGGDDSSPPPIR